MLTRRTLLGATIVALCLTTMPVSTASAAAAPARLDYAIEAGPLFSDPGHVQPWDCLVDHAETGGRFGSVELRVADLAQVGYGYEVWASRGPRELVYTGRMARLCVSGAALPTTTEPFGCYRSFRLRFGERGVRKVRLVVKNPGGISVAETTFFLADPFRARFVAKLAVRHCGDECRVDAQRVRALAGSMSYETREALRGLGTLFYQCAGITPMKIVRAAARRSESYATTATRAEWENSQRLDRPGPLPIFPDDSGFLDHHGVGQPACAPCIAAIRDVLEWVAAVGSGIIGASNVWILGAGAPIELPRDTR
ncbi:MAG: hypothetical protein ACKOBG_03525 [Actinomycetota bacterium]